MASKIISAHFFSSDTFETACGAKILYLMLHTQYEVHNLYFQQHCICDDEHFSQCESGEEMNGIQRKKDKKK